MTPVRKWLTQVPLVAVRRSENVGDPQPHPCFAVTHRRVLEEPSKETGRGAEARGSILRASSVRMPAAASHEARRRKHRLAPVAPLEQARPASGPLRASTGTSSITTAPGFRNVGTTADKFIVGALKWKRGGEEWKRGIRSLISKKRFEHACGTNQRESKRIFDEICSDDDFVWRYFIDAAAT